MKNVTTVLLLSSDADVSLPVIRALGSVMPDHISLSTVSNTNISDFPQYSRYVSAHHFVSANSETDFYDELTRSFATPHSTILLPLDEHYVRLVSMLESKLKAHFYVPPLPSPIIFDTLVNKYTLAKLLREYELPSPALHSLEQKYWKKMTAEDFPCIMKPIRGSSGRGIKKISSKRALKSAVAGINAQDYVLQEYISGKDVDCSFFAVDGEIKALTIQRGIESQGFSFSTAIKFENNEKVLAQVEKLAKRTNYSGVAHLDFRLDEKDNLPKLIDFNARFWLSLLGSKAAGVNFAYLYCLAALGIPFEKPDFREVSYVMGKSTFNYYYGKALNGKNGSTSATYTDLVGRIKDPLPEFMKFLKSG